jgi:hypothetical protein
MGPGHLSLNRPLISPIALECHLHFPAPTVLYLPSPDSVEKNTGHLLVLPQDEPQAPMSMGR